MPKFIKIFFEMRFLELAQYHAFTGETRLSTYFFHVIRVMSFKAFPNFRSLIFQYPSGNFVKPILQIFSR
jgi:hypothetical protein